MEKQEVLEDQNLMECAADLLAETHEMFETLDISALPVDEGPFYTVIVRALKAYYEYTCESVPHTLSYVAALEAKMTPEETKVIRSGLDGETLMYDPVSILKALKKLKDQVKGLTDEQSELTGTVEEAAEKADDAKRALDESGLEGVDLTNMQNTVERFEEFIQSTDVDDLVDTTTFGDLETKVDDNESRIEDVENDMIKVYPVKKTKADKALKTKIVEILESLPDDDEEADDAHDLATRLIAMVRGAS